MEDAGFHEMLTTSASGVVGATQLPLTVSLRNNPASHSDPDVFTFEIWFREELELRFRTLKSHAFTMTGGTVKKTTRHVKGNNLSRTITTRPGSNAAVISPSLPFTNAAGCSMGL